MLKNIINLLKYTTVNNSQCFYPAVISNDYCNPAESLVITDHKDVLTQARNDGYAVLFYSEDDSFVDGAKNVTNDLTACDYDYLNYVFCREKKLPLTILETKRCIVREMTVEDLPLLYELYDDDEIRKFIEPLYDYEEEKKFTESYIENMYGFYGFGLWLIFNKEDNALVGRAGLGIRNIDGEDRTELGYIIGRNFRKKGIATEVCNAIIKYSEDKLGIKDLVIVTRADNLASIKTAKKLGYDNPSISVFNNLEYMIFQ